MTYAASIKYVSYKFSAVVSKGVVKAGVAVNLIHEFNHRVELLLRNLDSLGIPSAGNSKLIVVPGITAKVNRSFA
jgi:hypothetical protein